MFSILRTQTRRYDNQGLELPPYCILYAYCLMSNHVHLLVQEREENISDAMKSWCDMHNRGTVLLLSRCDSERTVPVYVREAVYTL